MSNSLQAPGQGYVSINDIADGYFEMTADGRFTTVNDAMCRLLGDSREQILANEHPAFITATHPHQQRGPWLEAAPLALSPDRGWVEVLRKDGLHCTLEVTFQPKSSPEGRPNGYRGIARDATVMRQAIQEAVVSEKDIRRLYEESRLAEQRYQAFLEFLPLPVMVMESDQTISYFNPAFEKTFGWSLEEIKGDLLDFVPEDQLLKTVTGKASLIKTGILQNLETQRLTRDGRVLDVIYDGAAYYDAEDNPAGLVISLRDITRTKRDRLTNQTLFRISNALHSQGSLDDLLNYISRQTQDLLKAGRAHVILLDEQRECFYFRADAVEDSQATLTYAKMRIPVHSGVMGEVFRTQQPIIVNDYVPSSLAAAEPTAISRSHTRNMVQVPIWVEKKMIGILCVVNKKSGDFDQHDMGMLSTIAGVVALPIENARINSQLLDSYREISSLSKAKDCIIERLSHELRTPLSVITASLHLLSQQTHFGQNESAIRILARCRRNLNRLVDMQYQLEDIAQHPAHQIQQTLGYLLDVCADELESLVSLETGEPVSRRIRQKIDQFFAPHEAVAEKIALGSFVSAILIKIKPHLAHRDIELIEQIHDSGAICMPPEVLEKIIVGVVKNSVEYTPDGGRVVVTVDRDHDRAVLTIKDTGIGITEENKALIFENYFTTSDTSQYATRKPFDFNAGGRGFDLLRIKLFSERYHYQIQMSSHRCPFIPNEEDQCPGSTLACRQISFPEECHSHGGTSFKIEFQADGAACTR